MADPSPLRELVSVKKIMELTGETEAYARAVMRHCDLVYGPGRRVRAYRDKRP